MDAQGTVLIPLDEDEVPRRRAATLDRRGIEAIAILFLHSYRNPAHEQRAKEIVAAATMPGAVRHGLARVVAGISRVRAHLDGRRPTPMSARACGAISAKWTRI